MILTYTCFLLYLIDKSLVFFFFFERSGSIWPVANEDEIVLKNSTLINPIFTVDSPCFIYSDEIIKDAPTLFSVIPNESKK